MNTPGRSHITPRVPYPLPETIGLHRMRTVGLITAVLGTASAHALLFHASQRRPPLLMALFVVWVLLPFEVLLGMDRFSRRWSPLTRGRSTR
jgi:hypothetical protein